MLLAACSQQQWHADEGLTWGTSYHITYLADRDLHDSIRAEMCCVELSVSAFDAQSRLSAINAGRTDTLDAMLRSLVEMSQRVCSISSGAFDPTVMPLVDLWGFGPSGQRMEPTEAQIDSARALVGIRRCSITPDGRLLRPHPDMRFDFSAIAKGMGVDAVAAMLRRNGAENYMVEIGGEVATGGTNPRGSRWRIQIDAPVAGAAPGEKRLRVVEMPPGGCVATSGNYRNYRTLADGSRAGHIISPTTGRPAKSNILSATVIAPSCMLADALATAAMGLPSDSIGAMARATGTRFIIATECR